jgi:hypothetical protein
LCERYAFVLRFASPHSHLFALRQLNAHRYSIASLPFFVATASQADKEKQRLTKQEMI